MDKKNNKIGSRQHYFAMYLLQHYQATTWLTFSYQDSILCIYFNENQHETKLKCHYQ